MHMKIVVDSAIPFISGLFEPYAEVVYSEGSKISSAMIKDCDALVIRTRTRCDSKLLEGSRLRLIATATIGTDHIDEDYCRQRGIIVTNAAGCNARGVLQWVAAVLRHIVLSQGCHPADFRLGVVGVGRVGSLVARYARSWGFEVLECDPPRQRREDGDFRDFEELLTTCDILSFHTPLDNTTRHMLNADNIRKMRPNAIIINASRGAVVDNRAVMESGKKYYFDVWEGEPKLDSGVLSHSTLATPHIAGYSKQGKANATAMSVCAVASLFGFPLVGWYPKDVCRTEARDISWDDMCSTIDDYCDITADCAELKAHPERFEHQRDNYRYREEYF